MFCCMFPSKCFLCFCRICHSSHMCCGLPLLCLPSIRPSDMLFTGRLLLFTCHFGKPPSYGKVVSTLWSQPGIIWCVGCRLGRFSVSINLTVLSSPFQFVQHRGPNEGREDVGCTGRDGRRQPFNGRHTQTHWSLL